MNVQTTAAMTQERRDRINEANTTPNNEQTHAAHSRMLRLTDATTAQRRQHRAECAECAAWEFSKTVAEGKLAVGTKVVYDGRANGQQVGTIVKVEPFHSYYGGKFNTFYYHVDTAGLMVPAADILEVAR